MNRQARTRNPNPNRTARHRPGPRTASWWYELLDPEYREGFRPFQNFTRAAHLAAVG
jgi:hypothetical protein